MTTPMVVFRQDHTINYPIDGNKLVIPLPHAASNLYLEFALLNKKQKEAC